MMLSESDLRVWREARREGLSPLTAMYVVRPPVLALEWLSHFQVSEEWADFEYEGQRFRATAEDPANFDGSCLSCMELVEAWRKRDEDYAWMTDEEYERTDHRVVQVRMVDEAGEDSQYQASLWGVCGDTSNPTRARLDERYVADTVRDLADECLAQRKEKEAKERSRLWV